MDDCSQVSGPELYIDKMGRSADAKTDKQIGT